MHACCMRGARACSMRACMRGAHFACLLASAAAHAQRPGWAAGQPPHPPGVPQPGQLRALPPRACSRGTPSAARAAGTAAPRPAARTGAAAGGRRQRQHGRRWWRAALGRAAVPRCGLPPTAQERLPPRRALRLRLRLQLAQRAGLCCFASAAAEQRQSSARELHAGEEVALITVCRTVVTARSRRSSGLDSAMPPRSAKRRLDGAPPRTSVLIFQDSRAGGPAPEAGQVGRLRGGLCDSCVVSDLLGATRRAICHVLA